MRICHFEGGPWDGRSHDIDYRPELATPVIPLYAEVPQRHPLAFRPWPHGKRCRLAGHYLLTDPGGWRFEWRNNKPQR